MRLHLNPINARRNQSTRAAKEVGGSDRLCALAFLHALHNSRDYVRPPTHSAKLRKSRRTKIGDRGARRSTNKTRGEQKIEVYEERKTKIALLGHRNNVILYYVFHPF